MRKKLLYVGICIGIMMAMLIGTPNAHAYSASPVNMRLIGGYDDMSFQETIDRVYISAYDVIVFDTGMLDYMGPKTYQFDSLYETFIVEEVTTGEILYQKNGRDPIIFDTYEYDNGLPISFTSNSEKVYVEDYTSFYMYYVKEKEFTRPSDNLTLVVNVNNPIELAELNSLFGAWDNYSGNITDSLNIVEENYSDNMHTTGFYKVKFEAHDASNNRNEYTYTVWVKDDESPVVEPLKDIVISYTESVDITDLMDLVVATDNYTENLIISIDDENYMGNEDQVGEYFVEFMVDDLNGNAVLVRQKITVIDDVAPVISGKFYHFFEVEEIIRPNDILYPMSAVDDKDDGPIKVYIISNSYVRYQVGQFEVILGAKDKYGNEARVSVIIQVNDSTRPIFFIKIPQINVVASQVYSVDELLQEIQSLMTIQYTDIEIIENGYIGNEDKPGVYKVTLSANTGADRMQIQTQVRVNEEPPVMIEVNQPRASHYKFYIAIGLTVVGVSLGIVYIIVRKKKSQIN